MLDFEQWADQAISIVSGDLPAVTSGDGPPPEPDETPPEDQEH